MSIEHLVKLSIADLVAAYAAGSLSPVEVLKTAIVHAEAINPAINVSFSFRREQAYEVARVAEARWRAGLRSVRVMTGPLHKLVAGVTPDRIIMSLLDLVDEVAPEAALP